MKQNLDCIEIIRPFVNELAEGGYAEGQVIGGVGSAVLEHADVEIFPEEKLVVAPKGISLPQRRPKELGNTLRDVDFLVLSKQPEDVAAVESLAEDTIGNQLERSVFGLKPLRQLSDQMERPVRSLATVLVADRYVMTDGDKVVAARKSFFPLHTELDLGVLETWSCRFDDGMVAPIPHPGASVLNYLTRASYGIRPKDAEKVDKLTDNIGTKAPEIIDWIYDGPGSSQLEMARLLRAMGKSPDDNTVQVIGNQIEIEALSMIEVMEHEAFMFRDDSPMKQHAVLRVAQAKARFNRWGETLAFNHPELMAVWQKKIEPNIRGLLHNEKTKTSPATS